VNAVQGTGAVAASGCSLEYSKEPTVFRVVMFGRFKRSALASALQTRTSEGMSEGQHFEGGFIIVMLA
jgi:hypothetical protein